MKIYKQVTANNVELTPYLFKKKLADTEVAVLGEEITLF